MLRELLDPVVAGAAHGSLDVEVTGVSYDSRRVRPGDAFFALSGARQEGATFARQAVAAGAVAVVGEAPAAEGVTVVRVPEARRALARAAARLHGEPSMALKVAAVTGTNGKTTVTYLLESVFRAAGWKAGIIGTTGVHLGDEQRDARLTTPESPELQGLLAEMRERGIDAVALEVSSHALVQRRAYGLHGDVAVFTNLSHDHLDYHGTLEAYLDAKQMLFDGRNDPDPPKPLVAVVNADDPAGARIEEAARRGGARVMRYSGAPESRAEDVAVQVTGLAPRADGLDLRVETTDDPWLRIDGSVVRADRTFALRLPLLGRYNAANAAAAWAASRALGLADEIIRRGLEDAPGVPGRLERVMRGQPYLAVVDYAHSPDALQRSLAAVREHADGRVLLVFGCGGDRDRAKRPMMGRVAVQGADRVWVTDDNPRNEDPAEIVRQIEAGMEGAAHRVEHDRRRAIGEALDAAGAGDVVLIAGKGHETTQTIGERVLPFDDRRVAAEWLESRAAGGTR